MRASCLLVLWLLTVLAAVGCSRPHVDIVDWTVEGKPLRLPGSVAPLLAARGGVIHMAAELPVPPELRGAPMSIGINVQWCSPVLRVNGTVVDDVERTPLDGVRSQGAHLYRISSELAGDRLALTMEIPDTYEYCALFQNAPVLVRGEFGSTSYGIVRRFNALAPIVALSLLVAVGAAIVVLHLAGGRRAGYLWGAAATFLVTGNAIGFLGLSHHLFGRWGDAIYACALPGSLAGLRFLTEYFEDRRPSRGWTLAVGAALAAIPLTLQRYDESLFFVVLHVLGLAIYIRALVVLARHRRSRNGRFLFVTWGVLTPVFVVESLPLLGFRDVLEGAHIAYLGWVLVAVAMLIAFMRDHGAAATELRAELAAAERRQAEIVGLTDELRHQVAQRSRELREVLVRTEGLLCPERPSVGEVFDGRYRVVNDLGAGGMGAVFEVERRSDGRAFALKVVTGLVSGQAAARFAREAEIGARARHPNLVSIVDVGIARSSTPFLVMELVRGGSLEAQRARFGDAEWGEPILADVAEGLVALHEAGIVHRDLKPANVLLDGATARVADFGISRLDETSTSADGDAATVEASTPSGKITGTGMMLGTPLYMAPEAAFGEVGQASDVFSFGVMAYEVLTGSSAFETPPVHLALARQPLPRPVGNAVGILATVLACLSEEPSARPTARELAAAFRARRPGAP